MRLVDGQRHKLGLFQALDQAKDNPSSPAWAVREIAQTYAWMKANLPVPKIYLPRGAQSLGQRGLSWFKPGAREHIKRMHGLAAALSECGVHIELLTTRTPGAIIFEDRLQIVAIPLRRKF